MEFEKPNNNYHPNQESEGGGLKTRRTPENAKQRKATAPSFEVAVPSQDPDPSNVETNVVSPRSERETVVIERSLSREEHDHKINQEVGKKVDAIETEVLNIVYSAASEQGIDVAKIQVEDDGVKLVDQEADSDIEEALNDLYFSEKNERQQKLSPETISDFGLDKIVDDRFAKNHLVKKKIGKGGQGDIYRARQIQLNRDVGVKVFRQHKDAQTSRLLTRKFKTEMATISSIQHPNVLTVYAGGIGEEGAYFTMELANQGSLLDIVESNESLPFEGKGGVLDYSIQIAEGLLAIHQSGVVHRDLKPGNVLLHNGRVKLADFGVVSKAKHAYSLEKPDDSSNVLEGEELRPSGTHSYIAPEVYKGEKLSYKSDAFAYGALLFELATGYLLFDAEHISGGEDKLKKVKFDISRGRLDPEKVALLDESPKEFKQVVLDLLKANTSRRLNMYEALKRLQVLRGDEEVGIAEGVSGWNDELTLEEQQVAGKALVEENEEVENLLIDVQQDPELMRKELKRQELLKKMEEAEQRNLDRRDKSRKQARELAARSPQEKQRRAKEALVSLQEIADKRINERQSQRRKREERESRLAASQEYAPAQEVPGTLPPPLIQAEAPKPKKKQSVFKRAWGGIKSLFGRK